MTPMVDLFFLLLTFFMLTTTFRPQEAVQVDTPYSISEKISPERNVITLLVSKDDKVFFNIDNGKDSAKHIRKEVLENVENKSFEYILSKYLLPIPVDQRLTLEDMKYIFEKIDQYLNNSKN